ncbi:MAG: hypothetical protein IH877_05160 [Gemmatimonadetes bacterium]|nr:hypothetical protein [Gemmatimonadota bacterium]
MNLGLLMRVALLAAAFALGTVAVGWVAVPVIAMIWGAWGSDERPAVTPAAGAAIAWIVLMLVTEADGSVAAVAAATGRVIGVHGSVIVAVTIFFASALAGSGALTVKVINRSLNRKPLHTN